MRLAIHGACGRMGLAVGRAAAGRRDVRIVAAIEHSSSPAIGKRYGDLLGMADIDVPVDRLWPKGIDAVIDFSAPPAVLSCVREAHRRGLPLVIGTTGLGRAQNAAIRKASRKIACLVSSNMSLGVNLLFELAPEAAAALGPAYDIEVVETHHRRKRDAPSGTALTLVQAIAGRLNRNPARDVVYGRRGDVGERPRGEIGVHAVRAGGVVGEHRILFGSEDETIEIVHRAHSREVFAKGAVEAAIFVATLEPGLYSVRDLLRRRRSSLTRRGRS